MAQLTVNRSIESTDEFGRKMVFAAVVILLTILIGCIFSVPFESATQFDTYSVGVKVFAMQNTKTLISSALEIVVSMF